MKKSLCEIKTDANIEELRKDFKKAFCPSSDDKESDVRYICQMIVLDGFLNDGSISFTVDVPLCSHVYDTLSEACQYGVEHNGTMCIYPNFWKEENNYIDHVEIYCGYVIYETHDKTYQLPLHHLPMEVQIIDHRFCSPRILSKLQEAYEKGGQKEMLKWATKNL